MSNDWYNPSGFPVNSQDGDSLSMRQELVAIRAIADKLPPLTGKASQIPQINAGADGMGSVPYARNVWTPTFQFGTSNGDLALVYSVRDGYYFRFGPFVFAAFRIDLSTFTWTTASGNAQIIGLPFPPTSINNAGAVSAVYGGGITKAAYTQIVYLVNAFNGIQLVARGSGVAPAPVVAADMPSGGTPSFYGSVLYLTDAA